MTPQEANRNFGQRVKTLRRQRGWTQTELGERVHLSLPQIGRYERGVSTPTIDVVHRFADVFEISDGELAER